MKLLSQSMYSLSKNWFESLPLNQQQQITQSLGQFPAAEMDQPFGINGPMWHWWVTAILPLDPRIQLAMLAMTSYKERLQGLGRVLGYLNHKRGNQWLFIAALGMVFISIVYSYLWWNQKYGQELYWICVLEKLEVIHKTRWRSGETEIWAWLFKASLA